MSREQIKEMAKMTMKHCKIDNQCGSCHWSTCNECLAEVLYNAGYRKQSEVAREIFEEIEKAICGITAKNVIECTFEIDRTKYIELKKKYTEESTDGKRTDR